MVETKQYEGPSKFGSATVNAIGFGLLGNVVGGIPATISMIQSKPTTSFQSALILTTTLAGIGYGIYRGVHRAQAAQDAFAAAHATQAENEALKAQLKWASLTGKNPDELFTEKAKNAPPTTLTL